MHPERSQAGGPASARESPRARTLTITSLDALAQLAAEWRKLFERCPGATSFQHPAWILPYCRHQLAGTLQAVAVFVGATLRGLFPLFVWRDGAQRVLSLLGAGVSDYQDVLIDPTEAPAVEAAFAAWLGTVAVERCTFSELLPDSLLAGLTHPRIASVERGQQEVCPALVLGSAHEPLEQYVSKKLALNLRVARRRAEALGLAIEATDRDHLDEHFMSLVALHAARRAELGDAGTFAEPTAVAFHAEAVSALFDAGLLRMYGLRRAGRLAGVIYGFGEREALRFYCHGFDPALAAVSPGALLIAHAIERARGESCTCIDFLRGDEPYKYRWGARDRLRLVRRELVLHPPSPLPG